MGNKKSKTVSTELTQKQLTLLLSNTSYTEDEIRQWHAGFIRDCPNGRLDRKRFIESYQQLYPNGKADSYCKYAFEAFDTNDDGTIDFDEFLLAIAAAGQGDLGDRLSAAFDINHSNVTSSNRFEMVRESKRTESRRYSILTRRNLRDLFFYDVSDDGHIDRSELTKMIKAIYDLTGETNREGDAAPKQRAETIIVQLDEGGDRKLSKEEFIAGCKNDPYIRQSLAPNA